MPPSEPGEPCMGAIADSFRAGVRAAAYAKLDASAGASHATVQLAQATARMQAAAEHAQNGAWFWARKSALEAADCLADQGGIVNRLERLCAALLELSTVEGPGPGQEWAPGADPAGGGPILTDLAMKTKSDDLEDDDDNDDDEAATEAYNAERRKDLKAVNALEKRIGAVQKDADHHFAGHAVRLKDIDRRHDDHEDRINALGALCETLAKADRDLFDHVKERLDKIERQLVLDELRKMGGKSALPQADEKPTQRE